MPRIAQGHRDVDRILDIVERLSGRVEALEQRLSQLDGNLAAMQDITCRLLSHLEAQ